jgi:hypothetical protein
LGETSPERGNGKVSSIVSPEILTEGWHPIAAPLAEGRTMRFALYREALTVGEVEARFAAPDTRPADAVLAINFDNGDLPRQQRTSSRKHRARRGQDLQPIDVINQGIELRGF